MNATKLLKPALIVSLLLLASGCGEKYINLGPITSAYTSNFYKTEADMVNAINGTYSVLQRNGLFGREHIFADITSDDASTVSGACITGYCDFDNLTITTGGTGASDILNAR